MTSNHQSKTRQDYISARFSIVTVSRAKSYFSKREARNPPEEAFSISKSFMMLPFSFTVYEKNLIKNHLSFFWSLKLAKMNPKMKIKYQFLHWFNTNCIDCLVASKVQHYWLVKAQLRKNHKDTNFLKIWENAKSRTMFVFLHGLKCVKIKIHLF